MIPSSERQLERVTGIEPAIFCLGSRRSTTELHPREMSSKPAGAFSHMTRAVSRGLVAAFVVGVAALALPAQAQIAPASVTVDGSTAEEVTVSLKNANDVEVFHVRVGAGVLTAPTTIELSETLVPSASAPAGWERVSGVFTFDIKTAVRPTFGNNLTLSLRSDQDSLYNKQIFFFDRNSQKWRKLQSTYTLDSLIVTAKARIPFAQVAVFASHDSLLGRASWYRSTRYPNGVASNDFPMGTLLRVTNVQTNKSTQVRVVSTGPFVRGRVVDLSLTAFRQIARSTEGVIVVRVESLNPRAAQVVRPASLPPQPKIRAVGGYVVDLDRQTVLFDRASTKVRSLASLTKLMTALVVLDHNPSLTGTITFSTADAPVGEQGVAIRVRAGDSLSVKDVFSATLTGSANNASLALSRSTGLTRAQFLAEMNAKAKKIGMTQTTFVDPSGLGVGNLGSAQDIVKLIDAALDNASIRTATKQRTFTYTIRNTGERRTIQNPMYQGSVVLNDEPLLGGKTGYLDESLYNLAVGVNIGGQRVLVVVLGSPTRVTRNTDVEALIHYAQKALSSAKTG
jgi:D-alanyl-D-alanine endopeptidase (penicillin-binding protein 7)